jgi:EmrB/QacA subfamily drug resistance transporter
LKSTSRWPMAALSLSMLMSSLDTSIANAGLPDLAQAFGASFQQVQWIVLAYLLAITTLIVSVGRLGDMVGRRRLLLAGVGLFTVASLLCGLAPTLWLLVAARAVQGLGAATMMALAVAMVGATVPKDKTGSAMGLLGTMSALGTTLGPSLGGFLIAAFGWPSIFMVNVPLGLLNLLLVWRYLPADAPGQGVTFDRAGTVLLALTLAAYALAMTMGGGHFGALNMALIAAAICGAGLFLLVQSRAKSPLIRLQMLRDPALGMGLARSALVSTVMMTTLVVGPFYLAHVLGLAPAAAGLALSVGPLVAALMGVPAGRIVDRLGASRMTMLGLGGMATGAALLSVLPAAYGLIAYLAPIAVITASYALFQAANNTSVMAGASPDQRGVISGLLSLSRNLGLITGASLMGAVFALGMNRAGIADAAVADAEAVGHGMRVTFAVAAALMIAALLLRPRLQPVCVPCEK